MAVTDQVWPLAIVGRGSAAAYYLCSIDITRYPMILAVGEDDAWAGKRGYSGNASDPTLKINHPMHLLAHFGDTVPGFSTELVDRLAWARRNEAVLRECDVKLHRATITMISEARIPDTLAIEGELGPFGFRIDMNGPSGAQSVYAYKVVVCAGTGGHRVPPELDAPRRNFPSQVLDLDEFAKLNGAQLTPQSRVVVIGANAAIDAVHKALNYGCKIDWLIDLDAPRQPGMLATQPKMLQAWANPAAFRLSVYRYASYRFVDRSGAMLRFSLTPRGGGNIAFAMGDYIAYGVGPDGGPTGVIANTIQAKLKPISDGTRGLTGSGPGQATILGYEAEGTGLRTGLEVFGAMSGSIGREIANSTDRLTVLEEQIEAFRSAYDIYTAITASGFPVAKPFFAKSPQFLAKQPRGPLYAQLLSELRYMVARNPGQPHLRHTLEVLANQILAYHTAAAYASLGARDPNSLKNFRTLLNQVATNLPRGAVADHGQLTSINAALGAYATMHGNLPKYMPKQTYTTPGPQPGGNGKLLPPVSGTTTPGDINFNLDNAQNLAIFVCVSFPNIGPREANAFVDRVMAARHRSDTGFTDIEVAAYKRELATLEAEALRTTAMAI